MAKKNGKGTGTVRRQGSKPQLLRVVRMEEDENGKPIKDHPNNVCEWRCRVPKPSKKNARATFSEKYIGTLAQAEYHTAKLYAIHSTQVATGGHTNLTVKDMVMEFIRDNDDWGESTKIRLAMAAKNHIIPKLGAYRIDLVDFALLKATFDHWKTKDKFAPSYRGNFKTVLRGAFEEARARKLLQFNPMDGIRIDSKKKKKKTSRGKLKDGRKVRDTKRAPAMSDAQVHDFLHYVATTPIANTKLVLWVLMLRTGMRIGEACALRWQDFYPADNCIYVNSTLQCLPHDPETGELAEIDLDSEDAESGKWKWEWIVTDTKTEAGDRVVTIDDSVVALLEAFKEHELDRKARLLETWSNYDMGNPKEDELMFHGLRGGPMAPNSCIVSIRRAFQALEKKALSNKDFAAATAWRFKSKTHVLRHTYATHELKRDPGCLAALSEQLGHSDKTITLNTYIHVLEEQKYNLAKEGEQFSQKLLSGVSDIEGFPALPPGRGE